MSNPFVNLVDHFSSLEDPRLNRRQLHKFTDILVIAICAILSGVDNWVHIAEFGESKKTWFKQFLSLENGIPSHDTFGRVFSLLSPELLESYFVSWVQSVAKLVNGEIVPIDGKRLRGSYDKNNAQAAIHLVSAYASECGLVLGQVKTADKSNEISAIPQLLKTLYLKGCIVSIDAMGCQRNIADKIIQAQADYVLALKANQATLHDDVKLFFETACQNSTHPQHVDYHQTIDKGHGRIEQRTYWITSQIDWLDNKEQWRNLNSIGCVESTRIIHDKISKERRYYICSIAADAKQFAQAVRTHWSIESIHWLLDVSFKEDAHRTRRGHSAQNISILRRLALNILKKDNSKGSIQAKRLRAGWNTTFLTQLLARFGEF